MSSLLAIDLSTPRGHIAVLRADGVLYEQDFTSHRSHNSLLYAPLAQALEIAGPDLQKIIIGTGPGSYTGVRISIAAAQGVALSRNVPVVGLSSLVALHDDAEYLAVGDARRGKFYTAHVRDGLLIEGIALHDEAGFRAWLDAHAHLPCYTSDAAQPLQMQRIRSTPPNATLLARHGFNITESEHDLEPIYVQDAFITQAKTPTMGKA
jgi:tRNA threonylcarbamoyl adenosine modification protein YeaZ